MTGAAIPGFVDVGGRRIRHRVLGDSGPVVVMALEGENIVLTQDGNEVSIAHSNIEKAKLVPDFSEIDPAPKPTGAKPGKSKKKS